MKKGEGADLKELFELYEHERFFPEMLKSARAYFERSGNPYYTWYAIDLCATHKEPLPNWLMQYLTQCSRRMLSGKARETDDLREVLPWVLGFPKKRGPGKPLDPDPALEKTLFAVAFMDGILQGKDPVTARRNACGVLDGRAADMDDKTLQRWLLEAFNLKRAPANEEQWTDFCFAYFAPAGAARKFIQLMIRRELLRQTKSRETPP
jgi:hypothetical protein